MKDRETILCVSSAALTELVYSSGFTGGSLPPAIFDQTQTWFVPRGVAEECEDFKQLIPYVLLRCDDRLVAYRRTTSGGESRLFERWSVGFGGHVGLADVALDEHGLLDVAATLARAGAREVDEEVAVGEVVDRRPLGFIYDDRDPVGRVHVGVVELWTLREEAVRSAEAAVAECRLLSLEELGALREQLEGWSQLCVDVFEHVFADKALEPTDH